MLLCTVWAVSPTARFGSVATENKFFQMFSIAANIITRSERKDFVNCEINLPGYGTKTTKVCSRCSYSAAGICSFTVDKLPKGDQISEA